MVESSRPAWRCCQSWLQREWPGEELRLSPPKSSTVGSAIASARMARRGIATSPFRGFPPITRTLQREWPGEELRQNDDAAWPDGKDASARMARRGIATPLFIFVSGSLGL